MGTGFAITTLEREKKLEGNKVGKNTFVSFSPDLELTITCSSAHGKDWYSFLFLSCFKTNQKETFLYVFLFASARFSCF